MLRNLLIAALAGCALLTAAPREGVVPLFFVQAPSGPAGEVRFQVLSGGLAAWFTSGGATIRTGRSSVRLSFEGSNPATAIEGLDPLPARIHFLIGDPHEWALDLHSYARIVYRDLYPGIDLVYSGDGRNLKSEFVVAPGADPAQIRLRYSCAERVRLSATGELSVPVDGHELREQAPVIFQRGKNAPVRQQIDRAT